MLFKGFVRLNERFLYYSTQVHHRSRQILYHPFKQSGRIMCYKCKNEQKSINTISDRSGRWWPVVKWEHHFFEKDPLMWLHCQKSHLWYLGDSAVWRVMLKTKGFHSFSLFIPFLLSRAHTPYPSLPSVCCVDWLGTTSGQGWVSVNVLVEHSQASRGRWGWQEPLFSVDEKPYWILAPAQTDIRAHHRQPVQHD